VQLAIIGSRHYPNLTHVIAYVRTLPSGTTVITGDAPGVDETVQRAARAMGLALHTFDTDWARYGQAAGQRGAISLVTMADQLLAFWDTRSPATAHTISMAIAARKPVLVVHHDGTEHLYGHPNPTPLHATQSK